MLLQVFKSSASKYSSCCVFGTENIFHTIVKSQGSSLKGWYFSNQRRGFRHTSSIKITVNPFCPIFRCLNVFRCLNTFEELSQHDKVEKWEDTKEAVLDRAKQDKRHEHRDEGRSQYNSNFKVTTSIKRKECKSRDVQMWSYRRYLSIADFLPMTDQMLSHCV